MDHFDGWSDNAMWWKLLLASIGGAAVGAVLIVCIIGYLHAAEAELYEDEMQGK
jgi:hypothetical protein